jgi:integrase
MKLSQTAVAKLALPAGATDKIFFDDDLPGFGLRIRAGGSRKWIVQYPHPGTGKQVRDTLGSAAVLGLDEARKKARKVLVAVDDGKDPKAEKATKRAASGLIFAAQVDAYLDARQADLKARSLEDTTRYLRQHWKPLHGMAVGSITRAIVAERLRAISKENGPIAADRARSALSKFYAWLIGEGLAEGNPVIGTNKSGEAVGRERVLTDAELVAIWQATTDAGAFGRIVRLLMLTAQRRDEIGSLAWPEISHTDDSAKALIALPAARTKNSRPHDVPLSGLACDVVKDQPRVVGRSLVFGEGEGGFSGWSRSKARLDEACSVTDWTLHDLRRTAATRMATLGVLPHVIEAVLNHISGHKAGVAGIYNRATYAAEKRAALDLWANHVMVIVAKAEGANVTPIRRRTA